MAIQMSVIRHVHTYVHRCTQLLCVYCTGHCSKERVCSASVKNQEFHNFHSYLRELIFCLTECLSSSTPSHMRGKTDHRGINMHVPQPASWLDSQGWSQHEANTSEPFCCLIQQPERRMLCSKLDPSFPFLEHPWRCLGWQDLPQLLLVGNCKGWCTSSTCPMSPQGLLWLLFLLWQRSGPRSVEDSCSVVTLTRCQNFPEKYKAGMGNVDLTQLVTQPEQRGGSWEQGKACLQLQGFCPSQNSKVLFQTIQILPLVLIKKKNQQK